MPTCKTSTVDCSPNVYEWAGQLRYIDLSKPDQTGEQLLHHRWITLYTSAVVDPLQAETNLAGQSDRPSGPTGSPTTGRRCCTPTPSAWAILRWERSSADRNVFVAAVAGNGDLEPMRALLTQVAGGTVGVDRPVDALDDLRKLLHALAWTRVGLGLAPMKTASSSGYRPPR